MNSYRLAEGPSMHNPLVQTAKLFSSSMGLLTQFMLLSYYRTLSKGNHLPVRYSVTHISLTVMLRPTRHKNLCATKMLVQISQPGEKFVESESLLYPKF